MATQIKQQQQKSVKRKNARRWTNEKKALFAEVLVDDDNNFLMAIEKLALNFFSYSTTSTNSVFNFIPLITLNSIEHQLAFYVYSPRVKSR